jgi:hypothetical protein
MALILCVGWSWVRFKGHLSKNRASKSDPINLVFYGRASASRVASYLQDLALSCWNPAAAWHPTGTLAEPTSRMWAYLDDTASGGEALWKRPDAELAIGPYFASTRMHIRIFECERPDRLPHASGPDPDPWCIAGVHREHWSVTGTHIVHGWHEGQALVEAWFAPLANGAISGVGLVDRRAIGNEGWYQGHWHDGMATFVELR